MGRSPKGGILTVARASAGRMCHIPLGEPKTPNIISQVDEVGERIGGKVEAAKDELKDEIRELSRNVQDLSKRRGRGGRRRHSAVRREMCMHCWNVAQKDSALRYSLNTRMTHEAAYNRYRHELENIGIDSVSAFRRIIHSTQSLESAQRRKHLEEQRDRRWVLV